MLISLSIILLQGAGGARGPPGPPGKNGEDVSAIIPYNKTELLTRPCNAPFIHAVS